MHGDGTKLAITRNSPPPARLLDLTRLLSRAGHVLTGVDRVERAYLRAFLAEKEPVFGLVRTAFGYLLLDREGLAALGPRIDGLSPWGEADRLSRVLRHLSPMQKRAQSDARRLATARCRTRGLRKMLCRNMPVGSVYVNVGHSNLTDRVVAAVRHGMQGRITVLVHDTIPLDYPQFQRSGSVERFQAFLCRTQDWADLVICNSEQTRRDVNRHFHEDARRPETLVAHLGVDLATPEPGALPTGLPLDRPYFVSVGTIEPRKNHALLLDIWGGFANELPPEEIPRLFLCGRRGWENADVFARLDRGCPNVYEFSGLTDGAVAALVKGASGMLFPSQAEGFGLPPVEAAALSVPVICGDLAIYREILGDIPVYVDVSDSYLWATTIKRLADQNRETAVVDRQQAFHPPEWAGHFNLVLKST